MPDFTPDQITFLAAFADQGIALQVAEQTRVATTEAARAADGKKEAVLAILDANQQAEKAAIIARLDAGEDVKIDPIDPIVIAVP